MIPGIPHIKMNPDLIGQAELLEHIVYSENGQELSLLLPWAPGDDRSKIRPCPLILFVQGSAWTTPNLGYEIPMLSNYAEAGIAVATVCHRSAADGYPFPAFLLDVKCAIRFLRAHAADYAIDPEHIAAFGTSSGGNTVCLLGLTGDDPKLKTQEYASYSDAVCGVVSCFGPTDLAALFSNYERMPQGEQMMAGYFGRDKNRWEEELRLWSPVCRVKQGESYPPCLLLHGTQDPVVPCSQMDALYLKLKENGNDVSACYVDGAEHEGNFWGPELRALIRKTLFSMLGKA